MRVRSCAQPSYNKLVCVCLCVCDHYTSHTFSIIPIMDARRCCRLGRCGAVCIMPRMCARILNACYESARGVRTPARPDIFACVPVGCYFISRICISAQYIILHGAIRVCICMNVCSCLLHFFQSTHELFVCVLCLCAQTRCARMKPQYRQQGRKVSNPINRLGIITKFTV